MVKKYINKFKKSEITSNMVCMQLLRHQSITHYELSLGNDMIKSDQIVCIESLKLSLFAKSCICPGLVVLMTNLIKSSLESEAIDNFLEEHADEQDYMWLHEYWEGKKFEIYRI